MLEFDLNKDCYSCGACQNICPKGAIRLIEDEKGFLRPIIDKEKCIECGLCDKKCIYMNKADNNKKIEESKCYAMKLKNDIDILKSSSGGAFFELAKFFIKNGDYVCGCIWNKNMEAEHVLTNDIQVVEKMRGSKYVQSNIRNCYREIKEKLKDGYKVLFSGVPCQIAALKQITGETDNLYTISLICEGVPSRKVWKKYKEYLENKCKSKMISVDFRNKNKYGWNVPISKYIFENKEEITNLSFNLDLYVSSFIAGLLMNNKCYDCNYKCNNIYADIIIGDFWKVPENLFENQNKLGVSAVILRTKKGEEILSKVIHKYDLKEVSFEEIKIGNPNLMRTNKKT